MKNGNTIVFGLRDDVKEVGLYNIEDDVNRNTLTEFQFRFLFATGSKGSALRRSSQTIYFTGTLSEIKL